MARFATLGDACIDRIRDSAGGELVLAGGNALNVAGWLAASGQGVLCAVPLGADPEAARIRAAARACGIRLLAETRDLPTSVTLIRRDARGERHIEAEDFGACAGWQPSPATRRKLAAADHLHIGWLDDAGAMVRDWAAAGRAVSRDLGVNAEPAALNPAGLTIGFANAPAREAENLSASLLARGAGLAVVTSGAEGSLALAHGSAPIRARPQPGPVLDTTGAGDAFIAGFLAARAEGADLPAALMAGHRLAARACAIEGGLPAQA